MDRRAGVILVHEQEVLLLKRIKAGEEYWVVPGGGVHEEENTLEGAVRELWEEIELTLEPEQLILFAEFENRGRKETYYITQIDKREFTISGEEAERSSADNVYIPTWVSIDKVTELDLRPAIIKEKIKRSEML